MRVTMIDNFDSFTFNLVDYFRRLECEVCVYRNDVPVDVVAESDPELFFVPPYVGPSGWVGVRLDKKPDWSLVAELLEDGYRLVAPKRRLRELDED